MSASALDAVWVVVVNWNGGDDNLRCVASLVSSGVPEGRIVFIDNASSDGSRERTLAAHPGLVSIDNRSNLGFGAAANQGAREALARGAGAVLFANNDVTFPEQTVERMAEVLFANPRVGALAPRVLYPGEPARVWSAGGMIGSVVNLSTLLGHGELDGRRWRTTREVDYGPGCALLVRRAVLEDVGMFEESYFAYVEDVELGLRMNRAGWKVLCLGEVDCRHAASSATGGGYNARRKYMNAVNSVRFLREYGSAGAWLRFALFDVAFLPAAWLAGLPRGRGRAVAAKALGVWHGLLGRRVTAPLLEPGGTWLW